MNQLFLLLMFACAMALFGIGCGRPAASAEQEASALRFTMQSLAGEEVDLARYEGKVVMIVNVASKCGFTRQYEQLQALHEKYAERGLAVLGFPCNQFLGQEPGSAEQIAEFCRVNYGVKFDMFAKVDVNGPNASELYKLLTSIDAPPKGAGRIGWNFETFILGRNGFVVARFGSKTKPDAPEVVAVIERELKKDARTAEKESAESSGHAVDVDLARYRWKNRVVLLFAKSESDATYHAFRRDWSHRSKAVADRDLLLAEVFEESESRLEDTQLSNASAAELRNQFKIDSGTTKFILIGKDGTEKLRKESINLDELFEVIDAMPMRQREARSRKSD